MKRKLSIIIPCYNEKNTLFEIIAQVKSVDIGDIEKEIIVVDDGSTDGTWSFVAAEVKWDKLLSHPKNQGKGAAIRTGLKHATGDIIIIQDADLELDPNDFPRLLQPILDNEVSVVYGSRELGKGRGSGDFLFTLGGIFLTQFTNLVDGSDLTDMGTGYKVFAAELLKSIPLKCNRFDFCPEVTAKILRRGIEIKEVPISYYPRSKEEGKKIRWRDGIRAAWVLIRSRL